MYNSSTLNIERFFHPVMPRNEASYTDNKKIPPSSGWQTKRLRNSTTSKDDHYFQPVMPRNEASCREAKKIPPS